MRSKSRSAQYVTIPDQGVEWTCLMCDGIEETTPGYEPPSPTICPTCIRLALVESLRALGVKL
ncbi:hypothetical protein Misp01_41020 [Microtetraspora sp. NBRC 13810]|uniref:hypothetical protein n=1 Tax=Microtetraspora sp. NBRC 13810 TaxID=3030990 RepID=UPI0025522A5F|nr:hypothetical protein [Microtetraspora sp. NBRC 13810]GLW08972.1 hypothetical protein Misp01_41020 [Microtetraspora sp. NBRC 13810]